MPSQILAPPPTSLSTLNNDTLLPNRPPSPTAPPYSPITPTMLASLPATNAATAHQNPYPHAPPPAHVPSSPHPLQSQSPPNPQARTHQHIPPSPPAPASLQTHAPPPPPPQQPQYPKSEHVDHLPPSVPISESKNPDAIALRAAMSVLQIQRQQALRDLKKLEAQKAAAMKDPERFARAVQRGEVRARGVSGVGPYTDGADGEGDGVEDDDEMNGNETAMQDPPTNGDANHTVTTDPANPQQPSSYATFGEIPSSQNVVRMPPVNWAQYHIVGESLDKLHEEQRARPTPGQPARDEDLRPRERGPPSVVAGPYDPWVDKVGTKEGRTRNNGAGGGGKGGGSGVKKRKG